ncbi:MAG: hypothetical protein LUC91_05345 [Prevotella sp.]|nr:hypothetical protein [Prevotella sp.]
MALAIVLPLVFTSCSDDDDDYASKEHDTSICSEWIENSSNRYIFDYYRFYKDGTGIHGSYESDIDWIDEDDDITWYTEDNKYLYIDGAKYEYWCDGSSLELTRNGKTKYYYEK